MSGALLGAIAGVASGGGGGGGGGGGSDVTPDPITWPNASGAVVAATGNEQITGINTAITLSVGWTGAAAMGVSVNGATTGLGSTPGSITVHNNDEIGFYATGSGSSGTVTVKNVSDSNTTLSTFTYSVYPYGYVPPPPFGGGPPP